MPELKKVADHPALMALVHNLNGDLCWNNGQMWEYVADSMSVADGTTILKPTSRRTTQPGRWHHRAYLPPLASFNYGLFAAASGVLRDPGRQHINILRLASDVVDGEVVVIGDDTYEFDDDSDVTEGNIAVDVLASLTPAVAGQALADAINAAQGEEQLVAVVLSDNEVLVANFDVPSIEALACTTDMGGANNGWSAEAMYGGRAPAVRKTGHTSRVPTAQEVALGKLRILFDFTPTTVFVEVRVTATGVVKAWGGAVAIDEGLVTLTNGTDPDFAEADTVKVLAFE